MQQEQCHGRKRSAAQAEDGLLPGGSVLSVERPEISVQLQR